MSKYTDQQRLDVLEWTLQAMPEMSVQRCRDPQSGRDYIEISDPDEDDPLTVGATLREALDSLLDMSAAAKALRGDPK